MVEARREAAFEAADQRVHFAAMKGERADHARRGANHGARDVRRHALAARDFQISRDIVAIARIVLWIDDLEIVAGPDRQAEALDAVSHDIGAANQHGLGDALLQHHLGRAQHALVLAFGIDDALASRRALWRTAAS